MILQNLQILRQYGWCYFHIMFLIWDIYKYLFPFMTHYFIFLDTLSRFIYSTSGVSLSTNSDFICNIRCYIPTYKSKPAYKKISPVCEIHTKNAKKILKPLKFCAELSEK